MPASKPYTSLVFPKKASLYLTMGIGLQTPYLAQPAYSYISFMMFVFLPVINA